jgi:cytochrome c oxidase cbb3-type subunit I/II
METDAQHLDSQTKIDTVVYDDAIVRKFILATIVWGGVSFLVGLIIALQLANYKLNFGIPYITFGRLRPLHTNAAIFAFAGNAIFAGIYHSTQRLLKTRMGSDLLSKIHFWGWQLIIVSAALTLPFGITTSKEYAELEWPIDIAITVIWLVFGSNLILTCRKRRESHLYVAVWFYIATFVTVALLHVVNSLAIPVSMFKSYSIYAGVQDALVQWWYGHNAVAFFLTTPFLGLMYYYIPKAANRPVYSYRLSILHFWSLVLIYIWAGPHHLLNTALPEWAQTLGMAFSIMLWIPSWGGMLNGLLTLRGAWGEVRRDPVLKFLATATIFYGMSTFEGPLLSIKSVSEIGHYTDWIIGHVHGGALGWNGFLAFGMIYYLVPRLWKTKLHSTAMADTHFWLGTFGILLYMMSMWAAGITQGMMWKAIDPVSGHLVYPDFVETVLRIAPLYWVRALGGGFYILGYILMVINLVKTIRSGAKVIQDEEAQVPAWTFSPKKWALIKDGGWHHKLEGFPELLAGLSLAGILIGTIVELVPMLSVTDYGDHLSWADASQTNAKKIRPYKPLELIGRDIYVREGCYLCHSQMIRPIAGDVLRYGEASRAEESMYDHPFQWGSKRTGPDLARVGGKYPDLWHYRHMLEPRDVVPQSLMPTYSWLFKDRMDLEQLPRKMRALRRVGLPYSDSEIETSIEDAESHAREIADGLKSMGVPEGTEKKEIIALIAYLQAMGRMAK